MAMPVSLNAPTAASRISAVSGHQATGENLVPAPLVPLKQAWTFADWLIAGFCAMALIFAVTGVVVAVL